MIAGIFFVDDLVQNASDGVDLVDVRAERVHMDVDFHVVLVLQFVFQDVQGGVDFDQVGFIRDFGVDRAEHAARP